MPMKRALAALLLACAVVGRAPTAWADVDGWAGASADGSVEVGITDDTPVTDVGVDPGPEAPVAGGGAVGPATGPATGTGSNRNTLVLPLPDVHLAPPGTADQIVGVATWLWLSPQQWQPQSRTASLGGVSATVVARPVSITWDAGDGTTVECTGPGLAFTPGRTGSACTHVYLDRGDVTATVTVHWKVDWWSTKGKGGSLGTVDRKTVVPLHVVEVQATTD